MGAEQADDPETRLYGADAMVTNDRRWAGRVATPALLLPDDYLGEG
jgi:hypothetical protein